MSKVWQLQEAKSKFSELVEKALKFGPQLVSKRGHETVVVLSVDEFNKMTKPKNSLVNFFKKAPRMDLDVTRKREKDREIHL